MRKTCHYHQRHATYKSFSHSACRWSHFTTSTAVIIFICPAAGATIGDRAFAVAGPRAWNNLPDFITNCSSAPTVKQYLKTYLFSLSIWAHSNTLIHDCVKRPNSSLCRLRRSKIVRFYITLHPHCCPPLRQWQHHRVLSMLFYLSHFLASWKQHWNISTCVYPVDYVLLLL